MKHKDYSQINLEIINLLSTGSLINELGPVLGVSAKTGKYYVNRLYKIYQLLPNRNIIRVVKLVLMNLDLKPKRDGGKVRLSMREEVLGDLITQGYSNIFISKALGITSQTVKNHVRILLDKTGSDNRCMLAIWWKEHSQEAKRYSKGLRHEKDIDAFVAIDPVLPSTNEIKCADRYPLS